MLDGERLSCFEGGGSSNVSKMMLFPLDRISWRRGGGGVIMEKLAECPRRLGDARRKTHAGEGGREEGRREAVVECELSTTRAFDTTFSRPLRHPAFPTFPEHFFFYSIRKLIRSLGKNLTSSRLSPRLLASKGIEEDAVGTTYAKVKREGVV